MNVQYFTLIFSLAEAQKRQIPLSCILIRLYISLRATVSLLLPKLEDVHTNYLFCLSRHFAQYIKLQQTGNKSNNRICQVAQPSSENQIQEFVFCLLWKLCRETRCINLQSNSVTGFNYKPSPAIFFPPQWISSASVTPDEELRKSCWHFDRCTTSFFCGTVRVQIPGGDVALPLEYKTNPHMPAWQITYRYLCDLHQCGTSNRSCGGGGIRTRLNMSLWWRKWGYRPATSGMAFTSRVWWPKRAVGVCLLRSSAPQMPMLRKVIHLWEPPPLLIHQRRFTGRWHWSVTRACALEYHSPHQATVRRHRAQQHSTHSDFD